MTGYLLDTNILSELVRPRPASQVVDWIDGTNESSLFLSVLTLGEIRKGVAALAQSRRKTHLERWLAVDVPLRFADRILSVDPGVADQWGLLAAAAKRMGRVLPVIDGLLAATALRHNLTLVSRNTADFGSVPVFNPWEE